VYKNWLYRLMVEHENHVVCVWMSHEVDFMSVNVKDNIECWSLMVFDCNSPLYSRSDTFIMQLTFY